MPTTDLTPGTITTLGALRPGDVGEFVSGHGSGFSFVVTEVERDLTWIRSVHDKAAWPRQHLFRDAVRYLGRGRIEPARIVMEGEPDRIAELESQVRTLREYARECADNFDCDNYAHRYQTFCRQCEARAALAATAPKEIPAK